VAERSASLRMGLVSVGVRPQWCRFRLLVLCASWI